MKVIYNIFIPFEGFKAMTIWPLMFVRKEFKNTLTMRDITHETIHAQQQKETLIGLFYVWYVAEWLLRFFFSKNRFSKQAYYKISFEQEAFAYEQIYSYPKDRKHFAWLKYLFK